MADEATQTLQSHCLAYVLAGESYPSVTPANELIEVSGCLLRCGSIGAARAAVVKAMKSDPSFANQFQALRMLSWIEAANADFKAASKAIGDANELLAAERNLGTGERKLLNCKLLISQATVEYMESPRTCRGFLTIHDAIEKENLQNSAAAYSLRQSLRHARIQIAAATYQNLIANNGVNSIDLQELTGLDGAALNAFRRRIERKSANKVIRTIL